MTSPQSSSPAVSQRMSRQSSKDTAREVAVRRALYRAGLRYRVELPVPGMQRRRIDIAFTRVKLAIFIDGCFWHGCVAHQSQPKSNVEWWRDKLDRNMARDRETVEHLKHLGWTVLRFWEHEAPAEIVARIHATVAPSHQASSQSRDGRDSARRLTGGG
ncbi:very short patch repair endonuclease [Streptomyces sp. NPDC047065]|uniref:very short patch repair endonuclease n=1 Tax=Streptomyces sp. NPDC047065 TaxID=3154606 RepID=UPI0033FF3396